MFKKMFTGGLAMLLVLGLVFNATPAFAQGTTVPGSVPITPGAVPGTLPITPGTVPGSGGGIAISPAPLKLATINGIFLLPSYPPQLKITGTLPSSCYSPQVTILATQSFPPSLFIFVQAVLKPGATICLQMAQSFSTTVTLDANSLHIAPGTYQVLVNPVNGQTNFKTTIAIP